MYLSAKRWHIGYIYFRKETKSPETRGNHGVADVTDSKSHRLQPLRLGFTDSLAHRVFLASCRENANGYKGTRIGYNRLSATSSLPPP